MSSTTQDPSKETPRPRTEDDPELNRIVRDEEQALGRVTDHLANKAKERRRPASEHSDYDSQLLALRDEIACARLEDIPPLLEQMERLQSLSARRREVVEGFVDPRSPYFGRLVLEENGRRREVMIGRTTYLDTSAGIRIVDWRDAPVSRLYYRYEEGDDYNETFGDREVEGEVLTRRSVTITDRQLRRIAAPQGSFVQNAQTGWRRLTGDAGKLGGGQGTATRAEQHHRPGRLGTLGGEEREDRHLKEITALIDRRQFELITRPDSGLVVIQGGAGSGKTTIGLHRLAYLAFNDKRRFRPDRMLVVVFNDALARYISQVLPALDVAGVAIRTYEDWAARLRVAHLPALGKRYHQDTPAEVTRLKKHPAMLTAIEAHVAKLEQRLSEAVERAAAARESGDAGQRLVATFAQSAGRPVAHRLHGLRSSTLKAGTALPTDVRVALERVVATGLRDVQDLVTHWADLLTDREALENAFLAHSLQTVSSGDLDRAHAWCTQQCARMIGELEERAETAPAPKDRASKRRSEETDSEKDREVHTLPSAGIDGLEIEERIALDREDDALLLRLHQRLLGPLMRGKGNNEALVYEHVLIDEAQDLSPVELSVVMGTVSRAQSVTLAGDVAQRLHMDNGFTSWSQVLGELDLSHVQIEPLKLSYRSTQEIVDFSRDVLGPLAPEEQAEAVRHGAPVELFTFSHTGDAVGLLAESLRDLMAREPRASVAVIARYPEQADLYYHGLFKGEVPYLRRIAEQDFPFRPGIDVTDVRQVKGLEFDYVVLVEVTESVYPSDDESRHLLHIAATRAAHQLWVMTTNKPSRLLPDALREQAL